MEQQTKQADHLLTVTAADGTTIGYEDGATTLRTPNGSSLRLESNKDRIRCEIEAPSPEAMLLMALMLAEHSASGLDLIGWMKPSPPLPV